eukprot:1283612-Amphidinium_carterae.3
MQSQVSVQGRNTKRYNVTIGSNLSGSRLSSLKYASVFALRGSSSLNREGEPLGETFLGVRMMPHPSSK